MSAKECSVDRYDEVCKPALDRLESQSNKILSYLEGNGRPGLLLRMDRIEQSKAGISRFAWFVLGILGSAGLMVFGKYFL